MSVAATGSDASAATLFGIVRGRGGKADWSQPFVFTAADSEISAPGDELTPPPLDHLLTSSFPTMLSPAAMMASSADRACQPSTRRALSLDTFLA